MNLFDFIQEPIATPGPERAAVDVPERSWWLYQGEEVEIRGTSPVMVWFTRRGESHLAQRTIPREEFVRRARFLREGR